MNTEALLQPGNPSQIETKIKIARIGCIDKYGSEAHDYQLIEGANYQCPNCKMRFVKVFRYNSEVHKGRKTGYETAMFIKENSYNNKWSTTVILKGKEKGQTIPRRMRPMFADWKLFDENIISIKKQKTESPTDIIETAILKEIIKKEGNWFHFGDKKFNGKKKLMSSLNINDLQKIKNLCHELVSS